MKTFTYDQVQEIIRKFFEEEPYGRMLLERKKDVIEQLSMYFLEHDVSYVIIEQKKL